jgi:hypothetical protein
LSESEFSKLLHIFFNITAITAILFILQTVTGIPLLGYSLKAYDISSVGLFRFQNRPPLIEFFLLASFFYASFFNKKYLLWFRIIFILAIVVSMVRGSMLAMLISMLAGFMITGGLRKNHKKVLLIGLIVLLLFPLIRARFLTGETTDDIQVLKNSDYISVNGEGQLSSTLSWRIAWVVERWEYLQNRPVSESLFGLGLLSDDHSLVHQKYDFKFGLISPRTGLKSQIRTIDMAWGNLLTCLGILGSCFWFYLWFTIAKFLYKNKLDQLAVVFGLLLIYYVIFSIAHSELSEPYTLPFFFLPIGLLINRNNKYSQTKEK